MLLHNSSGLMTRLPPCFCIVHCTDHGIHHSPYSKFLRLQSTNTHVDTFANPSRHRIPVRNEFMGGVVDTYRVAYNRAAKTSPMHLIWCVIHVGTELPFIYRNNMSFNRDMKWCNHSFQLGTKTIYGRIWCGNPLMSHLGFEGAVCESSVVLEGSPLCEVSVKSLRPCVGYNMPVETWSKNISFGHIPCKLHDHTLLVVKDYDVDSFIRVSEVDSSDASYIYARIDCMACQSVCLLYTKGVLKIYRRVPWSSVRLCTRSLFSEVSSLSISSATEVTVPPGKSCRTIVCAGAYSVAYSSASRCFFLSLELLQRLR